MQPRLVSLASVALVAGLIPLSAGTAQSASSSQPPRLKPGWYVRSHYLNDPPAALRAIFERNLTAAEQLITSTSAYARPAGFEAQAHWVAQPRALPGGLRTYWVQIQPYVPDWISTAGGSSVLVQIVFNPEPGYVSDGVVKSETGETYFHERPRSAEYGTPFVYGKFGVPNTSLRVLFTARDQDPTLPVSREEYLRARIHELDGDGQLKEAQAAVAKTTYQAWMDGAAERKKEREEVVAAMPDRESAAKMRATLEKAEQDLAEGLKKNEPRDADNVRAMRGFDPSRILRDELAALTPQERASQAWVGGTTLMPAGTPNARRVIRANPAVYRMRVSPAEPRAILVVLHEPMRAMKAVHEQFHREFDWAALRKLLDTRP